MGNNEEVERQNQPVKLFSKREELGRGERGQPVQKSRRSARTAGAGNMNHVPKVGCRARWP